ncbi:MAG: MBL fold metallo-hydrolase [Candidatus Binatia bacterium]
MELRAIAPDVYACLQEDRGLGCSNSGLVHRGGGLVVDTFWDLPHTRRLVAEYARVRAEPVQRVVNTHHNGDHCWGNQLFPGAEIIGHRLCAAAFEHERPEMMAMLQQAAGGSDPALAEIARQIAAWDFSGITLTPPTTVFDERLDLDLDGLAVHLLYVGPAHTAGDVIVHLPAEGVVFAGDVLFRLCTPVGWQGTFARWTQALDAIIALAPDVIVPGHGPLCGVEGPREMRAYLEYVRGESRRGFDRGLPPFETAKGIDLGPYAGWTEPQRLVFQVERAYNEFRGLGPDTPMDAVRLFHDMYALAYARRGS